MDIIINKLRGKPNAIYGLDDVPFPSIDAAPPQALIARCPKAAITPLIAAPDIAQACNVGTVLIKDERARMGLGSFKALGAAYVIADDASRDDVRGVTYVTASAGNHGLSLAAGAQAFGARAVVYIAQSVAEQFARRLQAQGAEVRREGDTYEQSMQAAALAAERNDWRLLSDSSWPGYMDRPYRLMQGYLVLMAEVAGQVSAPPSHIIVQAGVGGLAGAVAAYARHIWGDFPRIIVVEPDAAPALAASINAAKVVRAEGPVSNMGRLDCKEPSLIALKGLAHDADVFATISEDEGLLGAKQAELAGLVSTPSGAAGLAGLMASAALREPLGLDETSTVLLILSEEGSL